ncbi:hypothetical protein [Methylomagnum ishizawai]|uniref:hypothetical protein n=1 Tax=Methylomagnum ishizawai TaxID=1760988 RepID=UPI001C3378B5|nr:hypothetical protein [Methylomagnum ishizawai]BBL76275.1 hypothetical protein MishRS11D_33730 [Methylomagnum ishizawai]
MNSLSLLLQGGMQLSLISVTFAAKIVQVLWVKPAEFVDTLADCLPNPPHSADAALTLAVAKAAAAVDDWEVRKAAQRAIQIVVQKRPALADGVLDTAKAAVMDKHGEVREAARIALETIIKQRPDLADSGMAKAVARVAATHGQWDTRKAAQQTLGLILDKNPELAETVLAVTKTAAQEGQDEIREAAQQTLELIVKKRPELADDSLALVAAQAAGQENEWYIRKAALQTLATILDKRPDLAGVVLGTARKLEKEGSGHARAVQQMLELIFAKRPDLQAS